MHIVIDLLLTIKNILLAFFISWIRFFVSAPKKDVRGEIVLVTGAGKGMGRELCIRFARLGATIVLWDIDEKGMEETMEAVCAERGTGFAYVCDVGDLDHVQAVGAKVKADVGDVTIVINNAGVVAGKRLVDLTPADIEATFNANLFGVIWNGTKRRNTVTYHFTTPSVPIFYRGGALLYYLCQLLYTCFIGTLKTEVTKHFLPSMIENNHGHIVNMASSAGIIGLAQLTDYSASKSGVIGFTEVLSYEMAFGGYDGIHTTLICPSYVNTGMFEGCCMPYPAVLADLELEPTVSRIMTAILTNQTHLCLPRLVYIMATLKTLMPTKALLEFIKFCKADKFMASFIGRRKERRDSSAITATSNKEE